MRIKASTIIATAFLASNALAFIAPTTRHATTSNPNIGTSSRLHIASPGAYTELAKTVVMGLAFGGGLIPATIGGNKAMMQTLTGKRKGGDNMADASERNLNGKMVSDYVEDSGASGDELPKSNLLFSKEKIPLVDVIAIIGRIDSVNSIADWKNLPSTKVPNLETAVPPMWLPRGAFKTNIRNAKFLDWPVDANGEPIGGADLKKAEMNRIKKKGPAIGDAALDAVFDTWAGGASIATPDKVEKQLSKWRPNGKDLDLGAFVNAAVFGRSLIGLGAFTFILIQLVAYGTLFIAPVLRIFFDIDIGFGKLGDCDPNLCVHYWPF